MADRVALFLLLASAWLVAAGHPTLAAELVPLGPDQEVYSDVFFNPPSVAAQPDGSSVVAWDDDYVSVTDGTIPYVYFAPGEGPEDGKEVWGALRSPTGIPAVDAVTAGRQGFDVIWHTRQYHDEPCHFRAAVREEVGSRTRLTLKVYLKDPETGGRYMDTVHIFISTGRFRSFDQMRDYIDETYTEDGDEVPSAFMDEVGLSEYEPGCIEAIPSESGRPVPLLELLAEASYSDQWLPQLEGSRLADAAICVFAPNQVERPGECSLEYLGAYKYRP